MKHSRPEPQPKEQSDYKIHPHILQILWEYANITENYLHVMLHKSVRSTHPAGNRRFGNYLFQIEGHYVYAVRRIKEVVEDIVVMEVNPVVQEDIASGVRKFVPFNAMKPKQKPLPALVKAPVDKPAPKSVSEVPIMDQCPRCEGSGQLVVYDQCSDCNGEGCNRCDDGLKQVQRTCDVCKGTQRKPKK